MSGDQLPHDFAPYHVVRLDLPRVQGAGKFHDVGIAASTLDYLRAQVPEAQWGILSDGGLLDDAEIERKPLELPASPIPAPRVPSITVKRKKKPTFTIVRKEAA